MNFIESIPINMLDNINEITLILSTQCNLSCSYCNQKHKESILDIESILDTFKKLKENNKINKNTKIDFFGGEPLLEYNNLIILYNELKKIGLNNFNIYSNAKLEKILEIPNDIKIITSYDGINQKYNRSKKDTDKILENLKILSTQNKIHRINFAYDKDLLNNYKYIRDLLNISEFKINHYLIREVHWWKPYTKIKEYLEDFKELIKYQVILNELRLYYKHEKQYLPYIQNKISYFNKNKLGCGLGKTRITILNNKILDCGIGLPSGEFNNFNKINELDSMDNYINNFCINCEVKNDCPKKCPIQMKLYPNEFKNTFCKIYKNEINIIKKLL